MIGTPLSPDVGTNEKVMAWIVDTYSVHVGTLEPSIVTGKPLGLHGSAGRKEATGHGVAFLAMSALDRLGIQSKDALAKVNAGALATYIA